jgi:hypothetical protein
MGRFYDGDIQGKFWVAVQESSDVENLVTINPIQDYSWKVCHCSVDTDSEKYCRDCYDCIREHIEAATDEGEYEDECLYYEDSSQGYILDKETHYEELVKNMELLKKEIPEKIINEFEKIEQNDKILDAFTGVFNEPMKYINDDDKNTDDNKKQQLRVFLARYILGYQIEYCLRTTESCNINCEY